MQRFTASVRCAKQMARYLNITKPVVIITDNTGLRTLIANRQLDVGAGIIMIALGWLATARPPAAALQAATCRGTFCRVLQVSHAL